MGFSISEPAGDATLESIEDQTPAAGEPIPLCRPTLPDSGPLLEEFKDILESRVLTNGPRVRAFEKAAEAYLDVRNCVAVSSCTSGLMLVLRAAELSGDVVVPSFTFAATAHAIAWSGLRPVFADIDPATLTLSPEAVLRAIGMRTCAILATHIYGTPCDVEALSAIARRNGIKLFFDAAHALGSRSKGASIGRFGDAEVFSLSPTKVVVAGEGGLIATNDDFLAERCRIGRDYANPGDYDCRFVGLNARMSEFHGALARASLAGLEERVEYRNTLAGWYRKALEEIPGIEFPTVPYGDRSTFKDFTVMVDDERFGMSADRLAEALKASGVETRRYYHPPVHQMQAYAHLRAGNGHLPITERASARVISLPLWSEMSEQDVASVTASIQRIHQTTEAS